MSAVKRIRSQSIFLLVCLITTMPARGQLAHGELRIEVRDPQGSALAATAEIASDINQLHRTIQLGSDGRYAAHGLPFGTYRLTISAPGFSRSTKIMEIRSEAPVQVSVTLSLAAVTTEVEVSDSATIVDPYRTGMQYAIAGRTLSENIAAQPGRNISDLIDELPGWLYEANGVLHPRGSEYDVQYVVDGVPITQNRSPAFAPPLDATEVESMQVRTANYPAEYGRKLGGVVEVSTAKDAPAGLHGNFDAGGGSFSTTTGSAAVSYAQKRNSFSISADAFLTDRYLDPPVLHNFTNRGDSVGFSAFYTRDFSDHDRLHLAVTHTVARFLVPNYLIQENAGQRQDITNSGTDGELYFQHAISSNLLLSISCSVRDEAAELKPNALSTPVIVSQDRGYREGYGRVDLAGHHGRHDWKVGVDTILDPVREKLQYAITDRGQFDPGTQQQFQFSDRRWDVEPSAYLQDHINFGNWNLDAGLRFDHYAFLVHDSAWSPRVGGSRYIAPLKLSVHVSYDRIFQTPALENLLLASSPHLDSLQPFVLRLPVPAAHANYYEAGVTKAFFGTLRLDANIFRRDFKNYSDDDVLLDTGISFPISFARGRIAGEELRLEVPHWGRFSGYVSYANQSGIGRGPVTGGLLLGAEAMSGLTPTRKFAVSQDQRNTARARVRFQALRQVWLAAGGEYGSGLPAESEGVDVNLLLAQYGAAILDRVNLDRGRVRPNFSLDAAAGVDLYHYELRSASFQIQSANLTNRVNVINFASLFSGTAIAPPRSVSARLRLTF
ncbi:MAG: TonB-dependent receptor [Acidobacteriales bacterium]|nr:TonB-dependent receptor [Terriglobales bacterium]